MPRLPLLRSKGKRSLGVVETGQNWGLTFHSKYSIIYTERRTLNKQGEIKMNQLYQVHVELGRGMWQVYYIPAKTQEAAIAEAKQRFIDDKQIQKGVAKFVNAFLS